MVLCVVTMQERERERRETSTERKKVREKKVTEEPFAKRPLVAPLFSRLRVEQRGGRCSRVVC